MVRWGAYRGLRTSKFNAAPTRCSEGVMHKSKKESRRCTELHVLLRGGLITELEAHPQPRFDLEVNGVPVCAYIADFRYRDADGEVVVEDTKGWKTPEYKLKNRLMLACHGIDVKET